MKKESVRKQEAREQMKKRAGQAAAAVGVAGTGTAFAASAFNDGDEPLIEEEIEEVEEVGAEEPVTGPKPAQKPSHAHHSQSASQAAAAPQTETQVLPQEDIVDAMPASDIAVEGDAIEDEVSAPVLQTNMAEVAETAETTAPAFTPMHAVSSGVYEVEIEESGDFMPNVSDDVDYSIDGLADVSLTETDFPDVSIDFDDMISDDDIIESSDLGNDFGIEF